jgi:hypothetical protein
MLRITRTLVPAVGLWALTACAPVGGLSQPPEASVSRPAKYRAMILSTVSSGLQVGSQSNIQPQTQIGTNTQQLFVFVFGNNNVVTVDQTNLMPFLNLNWVDQAMGQTQIAGDVTSTSNTGSLQWDPNSLTTLLGASPTSSTSPVDLSNQILASPSPSATPALVCAAPAPTPEPAGSVPAVEPTPTPLSSPTPIPTVSPTPIPSPTPSATSAAASGPSSDSEAMAVAN